MFMLSRHAAIAAVALLGAASLGIAADNPPMHMMDHHDVTILHLVETATTTADHEAVAKRFEEEATQFDKQAAEHEQLAAQYRNHPNPWANKSAGVNTTEMAAHCERIAKSLKASAAEAREMAQLHRDVGKVTTPEAGK